MSVPADVGGAMRLGGSAVVNNCSFLSNSALTRGLAVAVVGSADISDSVFDGNEFTCAVGSFQEDASQVKWNGRRRTRNI